MATLYEIDEKLANIFVTEDGTSIDGMTGEVLDTNTLDNLKMEKWQKVDNICRYVKNLRSDAEQYREESKRQAARAAEADKKAESLMAYLASHLEAGKKADVPSAQIRWRRSTIVDIKDERMLPAAYLKQTVVSKPDKVAIKKALQAGHTVLGAKLEEKDNLSIK